MLFYSRIENWIAGQTFKNKKASWCISSDNQIFLCELFVAPENINKHFRSIAVQTEQLRFLMKPLFLFYFSVHSLKSASAETAAVTEPVYLLWTSSAISLRTGVVHAGSWYQSSMARCSMGM